MKHKVEIEAAEKADKEELKKASEFSVQIKTEGEVPKLESENKSEQVVKPESEKKPEILSEPKTETVPAPKLETEVKPETKSETVTESETKSETVSESKTEETAAPVSETKTEELSATQEAPAEIKSEKAEEEEDYDDPVLFYLSTH